MALLHRKLAVLQLPNANSFNIQDESAFRNLILTLEDKAICLYKIEERAPLRKLSSDSWPAAVSKYLSDLKCPYKSNWQTSDDYKLKMINWLLSYAISLEYTEKADMYNSVGQQQMDTTADESDLTSDETHAALQELATLLHVAHSDDISMLWRTVSRVIRSKFTPNAVASAKEAKPTDFDVANLMDIPLGFDTGDKTINRAAKILRLLHLVELRGLQTQVNELIISVQNLVANPKTDSRLGQIGR